MPTNLVAQVMQFLTPDMIGRMANALGLGQGEAQQAVSAAVPALLAGLSGVAAKPGGAQKLADVAQQHKDVLGNVGNMLAGADKTTLAEKGSQMLSSLFGPGDQSTLSNAVGKFTGLGQRASSSLLGMLGPVVMGAVAREGSGGGANGIAKLLASQKDNIAEAMPSGFGKVLDSLDSSEAAASQAVHGATTAASQAARGATTAAGQAARDATSAAHAMGNAGERAVAGARPSSSNWLWLIPLAAIAGLLAYWFAQPVGQMAQQGAPATQNLTVDGVDMGKQVTDGIANLRTALGDVSDPASAQAALPKLQQVNADLDKVGSQLGQLSDEQRTALSGIIGPLMPEINAMFEKVMAIPGVGTVLGPTVDALKQKLTALES